MSRFLALDFFLIAREKFLEILSLAFRGDAYGAIGLTLTSLLSPLSSLNASWILGVVIFAIM